eukprot:scaffold630_cov188-Ochromonas_danica.AAC.4
MTPLVYFLFFLLPSSHCFYYQQRQCRVGVNVNVNVIPIGASGTAPHIPCRPALGERSPAHSLCFALYAKPSSSSPSDSDQQDKRKTTTTTTTTTTTSSSSSGSSDTHSVVLLTESLLLPISSSFLSSTLFFHSSTLRYFFTLKDEAVSFWTKIEHRLQTSKEIFQMRAERDLRSLTAMTDLFQRRIVKESSQRVNSLEELEEPVSAMQEVVKQIISDPSSMSLLLRGGLHKKSKLVGGLSASTTKQRAQAIRSGQLKPKKEEKVTPDAIYRSVRLLPKQIDYGYQQRQRRREAQLSQENTRLRELPSSATATATARQGRGGSEGQLPVLYPANTAPKAFSWAATTSSSSSTTSTSTSATQADDGERIDESISGGGMDQFAVQDVVDSDDVAVTKPTPSSSSSSSVTDVIETTAEVADGKEKRYLAAALKVIDVSFFVLESVIKATGPLLSDRGQLAWSRIVDTFPAALKKKEDSWQLFGQFKKPSSSSPPSK